MSKTSFNFGQTLVKQSGWGQSLMGAASSMVPGGQHLMSGVNALSHLGDGNPARGLSGITSGDFNRNAAKPTAPAKAPSITRSLGAPSTNPLA